MRWFVRLALLLIALLGLSVAGFVIYFDPSRGSGSSVAGATRIQLSQLMAIVTSTVLQAVLRQGNALPAELVQGLDGRLARLRGKLPLAGVETDMSLRSGARRAVEGLNQGLGKLLGRGNSDDD